ncbi:DNA polymerase, partial [Salmonella enterica subsp. enterica serovar Anatum]|nr:DNA polymerase [Salmonella enterica subsp. enterica serovar Anatum]
IAVDAWLQAEQPRVRMIMQVHDELVFEVHKDDLDAVAKRIHHGDSREEALKNALDALVTAFEFYFEDGERIPEPGNVTDDFVEV